MLAVGESVQESVRRLNSWDFSRVRDFLVNHAIYEEDELDDIQREYTRYLALIVGYGGARFIMSSAVDDFWHAHVLHTKDYQAMCHWLGRGFIHHHPTSSKAERDALSSEYDDTIRTYAKHFGTPGEKFWPGSGAVCLGN